MVQAHVVLEHGVASACVKCEIERTIAGPSRGFLTPTQTSVERVRRVGRVEGQLSQLGN